MLRPGPDRETSGARRYRSRGGGVAPEETGSGGPSRSADRRRLGDACGNNSRSAAVGRSRGRKKWTPRRMDATGVSGARLRWSLPGRPPRGNLLCSRQRVFQVSNRWQCAGRRAMRGTFWCPGERSANQPIPVGCCSLGDMPWLNTFGRWGGVWWFAWSRTSQYDPHRGLSDCGTPLCVRLDRSRVGH